MTFRHLALAALLSAAIAFAACGGDDDSSEPANGGNPTPTEAPTNGGANGNGNEDGSDSDGSGSGSGSGVEGDRAYEFDLSIQCRALFGNMAAAGRALDGSDVSVNIQLPPNDWETDTDEDWESPSITVRDDENDLDWRAGDHIVEEMIAGGTLVEGLSQVDSFTHDGKRASGTATFVDLYKAILGSPEPVQGTFEFACAD